MRFFVSLISAFATLGCSLNDPYSDFEWSRGKTQMPSEASDPSFDQLWQVGAKSEFVEYSEQKISSVPVDGSFLKKVRDKGGEVIFASGRLVKRKLSLREEGLENLLTSSGKIVPELMSRYTHLRKFEFTTPELRLVPALRGLSPFWFVTYFDKAGLAWELVVSPELHIRSVKQVGSRFHNVNALVYPRGPKASSLSEVVLKNLRGDGTLASPLLSVTTLTSAKISGITENAKFNPPDERFDQVQVFWYVSSALEWFEKNLGSRIPSPLDVQVHVGTPEKTNTAFYYQNKIRLGSGDDVTYSKIPQDPSIVTHETAHALIDALARLPFEGEGGSLNEAFADFFTAVMLKNPNMGEVSYLKGPFRRTLNNSKTVSQKNGGLYHDSGIVSGTLWDFYNTLGEKKSLDIAVRTLSRLTPRSDFDDFRNKLKDVCSSLLNAEDLESANKILSVRGWL